MMSTLNIGLERLWYVLVGSRVAFLAEHKRLAVNSQDRKAQPVNSKLPSSSNIERENEVFIDKSESLGTGSNRGCFVPLLVVSFSSYN